MWKLPPGAFLGLFVTAAVSAVEPVRISIPGLRDPATRLHAVQQYRIQRKPREARDLGWEALENFAQWHPNVRVTVLQRKDDSPRYLVTWDANVRGNDWSEVDEARKQLRGGSNETLHLGKQVYYQIFRATGEPTRPSDDLMLGNIADLNHDGELEIASQRRRTMTDATLDRLGLTPIPGMQQEPPPLLRRPDGPFQTTVLEIHRAGPDPYSHVREEPLFSVVYNTHPLEFAAENTWGCELIDLDHDGIYEIQLGPLRAAKEIEPRVVFRWNAAQGTWVGPAAKRGDHFRALTGPNREKELTKIIDAGGLGYPLVPAVEPQSAIAATPRPLWGDDDIAADKLSKPYRYRSLAGISNEELLAWMGDGPTVRDYAHEQMQELTSVPKFWELEPKSAALAYVKRNRLPDLEDCYLLAPTGSGNSAVPMEGDVILSDAPSGCFARHGAFVHQLHCAKEGSYFVFSGASYAWANEFEAENRVAFDLRKLDLPYSDARHLLQIIWWLSQVRSEKIAERSDGHSYSSGGSTSDGRASVQLISAQENITIEAGRSAGHTGMFQGVGLNSEEYDPSAFINLVVQLFRREISDRFGQRWNALAIGDWRRPADLTNYTPEQIARLKAATRELLHLYKTQRLATAAVHQAVSAVGIMGWHDLRREIAALANYLPPLLRYEQRVAQLEGEVAALAKELGPEANDRGYRKREEEFRKTRAIEAPATLNLLAPLPAEDPRDPPLSEAVKRFALFDAKLSALRSLRFSAPAPDLAVSRFRALIPFVLKQLDLREDVGALKAWAREDEEVRPFAFARLSLLAPPALSELLRELEAGAENEMEREHFRTMRSTLEKAPERAPTAIAERLDDAARRTLVATVRDANADYRARERALEVLVPENAPQQNADPEIDRLLHELLKRPYSLKDLVPIRLPMAAAQRLGGRCWDDLVTFDAPDGDGHSRRHETLPAMTWIALHEPEPFRAKFRDLLAPELRESHGGLNSILVVLWLLDLRELKTEVERIATSSPQDYEGAWASTSTNQKVPIEQRFHLGRQIAQLWNEEDPEIRARLNIAFSLAHGSVPGALENSLFALRAQLAALRPALTAAERKKLDEFAKWCAANATSHIAPYSSKDIATVLATARNALQLE